MLKLKNISKIIDKSNYNLSLIININILKLKNLILFLIIITPFIILIIILIIRVIMKIIITNNNKIIIYQA